MILFSASGDKGKYRIDYSDKGSTAIETFEDIQIGILETSFGANGDIVGQKLLKREIGIGEAARTFLSGMEGEVKAAEYRDVELSSACPKCGSANVARDLEALGDKGVPIVPRYICKDCSTRSYRLNDRYLEKLVYSNKDMFSNEELEALSSDSAAFIKELREYIIRIFASKKVIEIR